MNPTVFRILVGCIGFAIVLWAWLIEDSERKPPSHPYLEKPPDD